MPNEIFCEYEDDWFFFRSRIFHIQIPTADVPKIILVICDWFFFLSNSSASDFFKLYSSVDVTEFNLRIAKFASQFSLANSRSPPVKCRGGSESAQRKSLPCNGQGAERIRCAKIGHAFLTYFDQFWDPKSSKCVKLFSKMSKTLQPL